MEQKLRKKIRGPENIKKKTVYIFPRYENRTFLEKVDLFFFRLFNIVLFGLVGLSSLLEVLMLDLFLHGDTRFTSGITPGVIAILILFGFAFYILEWEVKEDPGVTENFGKFQGLSPLSKIKFTLFWFAHYILVCIFGGTCAYYAYKYSCQHYHLIPISETYPYEPYLGSLGILGLFILWLYLDPPRKRKE